MPLKNGKEPDNPWLFHLMKVRDENKDKSYREILDIAKNTYQSGGRKRRVKKIKVVPIPASIRTMPKTDMEPEVEIEMEGEGIREAVKSVKQRLKAETAMRTKKIGRRIKVAFRGRDKLPLSSRKTLDAYGDDNVVEMFVVRRPIMPVIEKTFKLFAGNYQEIKKNLGYDALQHLSLNVRTDKGLFRIEKLGDDDIKVQRVQSSPGERMDVNFNNRILTMNEMLRKTEASMGSKFLPYDSQSNNCQVFVTSILRANNLLTPDLSSFINQDIERLYKELKGGSVLRRLVQAITDLGGVAERAIVGEGLFLRKREQKGDGYTFRIMR